MGLFFHLKTSTCISATVQLLNRVAVKVVQFSVAACQSNPQWILNLTNNYSAYNQKIMQSFVQMTSVAVLGNDDLVWDLLIKLVEANLYLGHSLGNEWFF